MLSHTAPPCESDFDHTTNHQKLHLFAAGFFTKTCPTPQIQPWGSGRKGAILQKNEQNQQEFAPGRRKQQSWEHAASTHSLKSRSSHWKRVLGNWIRVPETHWATQYKCFCTLNLISEFKNDFETRENLPKVNMLFFQLATFTTIGTYCTWCMEEEDIRRNYS